MTTMPLYTYTHAEVRQMLEWLYNDLMGCEDAEDRNVAVESVMGRIVRLPEPPEERE